MYIFKDLSEVLLRNLQLEFEGVDNAIVIEFDDVSMKTKLVVRSDIIATKLNEKSFFISNLAFNPFWDYKLYNRSSIRRIVNFSTRNEIHLKCDVIDGSIVDGLTRPIFFRFVLEKPSSYKVFCEPETTHYKKK